MLIYAVPADWKRISEGMTPGSAKEVRALYGVKLVQFQKVEGIGRQATGVVLRMVSR